MNSIKTVGSNGQISLGKKYAGQTVMLDEIDTGVWIVKPGSFVPHSEKWLHEADAQAEYFNQFEMADVAYDYGYDVETDRPKCLWIPDQVRDDGNEAACEPMNSNTPCASGYAG